MSSLRVLVLAGGNSAEREVSLESGECVAAALSEEGCKTDQLDPADTDIATLDAGRWDVAFPLVHGTGGEDGVLQRDLLCAGIPYVGSSPATSALTFDKSRTRECLTAAGIRMPPAIVVRNVDPVEAVATKVAAFGFPVVVKPTCQGSSVGVTIVHDEKDFPAALETALTFGTQCLVERFISGREVTVPIVDGVVFPAIEIVVAEQWYDYRAKYTDDRTQYRIQPGNLPDDLGAIAAFSCRLCDVEGIARVDFRVDRSNRAWLLEVNTIPGMTSHSLVPKSAAAQGLTLGELCLGSIRHRLRQPVDK